MALSQLASLNCANASQEEALKKAAEAALKQSGMEARVNEIVKDLVPKKYEEYLKNVGVAANILHQQRLEIKWEW